ncbi:MAG: response regulator, partial [Oligoflexia bacterium]|nr:response regulator [Oligoflexia bacterium]
VFTLKFISIQDPEQKPAKVYDFLNNKSLLVVDDEITIIRILEYSLGKHVSKLYSATDGAKALDLLIGNRVDAVLTDIKMPNMDGYELASRISKLYPDLPVISISGSSIMLVEKQYEHLFAAAVEKPFTKEQIIDILRTILTQPRKKTS